MTDTEKQLLAAGTAAAILYALSRTKQGEQVTSDALEDIIVTGGRIAAPVVNAALPRGLRNNNPGNIRRNPANRWQGAAVPQSDNAFVQFVDMVSGVRALALVLKNYERQGLDTVRKIISRWAPPTENDTGSYVRSISRALGVDPDARIDVQAQLPKLVRAIARHENGPAADLFVTDADITEGVRRA
jgi:hypothetical protein